MKQAKCFLTLAAATAGHAASTLYGQLNLSFDNLDNGTDSALNPSSDSGLLGVRGEIQTDSGVTGIYQIESEVNADTGSTSASGFVAGRKN